MVNQKIQDRLAALRAVMKENGVDWYMVPTADFHNSEYVDAYFKVREYLCNFSGSNGTLIVGMDEAGLWTDGRYFIQAERELTGTGVTLYRMLEDNVPTKEEFLQQKMENGQTLGFDGRVVDTRFGLKLEKDLADWVLSKFSAEERKALESTFGHANDAVELIVDGKIDQAMNQFNS